MEGRWRGYGGGKVGRRGLKEERTHPFRTEIPGAFHRAASTWLMSVHWEGGRPGEPHSPERFGLARTLALSGRLWRRLQLPALPGRPGGGDHRGRGRRGIRRGAVR
jgi:hypothetical protein